MLAWAFVRFRLLLGAEMHIVVFLPLVSTERLANDIDEYFDRRVLPLMITNKSITLNKLLFIVLNP